MPVLINYEPLNKLALYASLQNLNDVFIKWVASIYFYLDNILVDAAVRGLNQPDYPVTMISC